MSISPTRLAAHYDRHAAVIMKRKDLINRIATIEKQAAAGTGLPGTPERLAKFRELLAQSETELTEIAHKIKVLEGGSNNG